MDCEDKVVRINSLPLEVLDMIIAYLPPTTNVSLPDTTITRTIIT